MLTNSVHPKRQIQNQMDALRQVMDPLCKSKTGILHNLGSMDNNAVKKVEKKMDGIRSVIRQVEHRQHALAGNRRSFRRSIRSSWPILLWKKLRLLLLNRKSCDIHSITPCRRNSWILMATITTAAFWIVLQGLQMKASGNPHGSLLRRSNLVRIKKKDNKAPPWLYGWIESEHRMPACCCLISGHWMVSNSTVLLSFTVFSAWFML